MANMNPNYLNLDNEHPSTVHAIEVRQELGASESLSDVYAGAYGGERHVVEPSIDPKLVDEEHEKALAEARARIGHLVRWAEPEASNNS